MEFENQEVFVENSFFRELMEGLCWILENEGFSKEEILRIMDSGEKEKGEVN